MLKTRLKESRERVELTQKQVANMFNVHETTVSGWETGKDPIPLIKLIKYCEQFDYSIDYILKISNDNLKYEKNARIDAKIIGENLKKTESKIVTLKKMSQILLKFHNLVIATMKKEKN